MHTPSHPPSAKDVFGNSVCPSFIKYIEEIVCHNLIGRETTEHDQKVAICQIKIKVISFGCPTKAMQCNEVHNLFLLWPMQFLTRWSFSLEQIIQTVLGGEVIKKLKSYPP